MSFTTVLAALSVSTGGAFASFAATAAESAEGASNLAPWLQGGGSAAAVAGLVYVARMIVKGDLVPRAVADRENETAAAIRVAADNAHRLEELTVESHAREVVLASLSGDATRQQALVEAELRWWRDQRERGRTVALPRRTDGGSE